MRWHARLIECPADEQFLEVSISAQQLTLDQSISPRQATVGELPLHPLQHLEVSYLSVPTLAHRAQCALYMPQALHPSISKPVGRVGQKKQRLRSVIHLNAFTPCPVPSNINLVILHVSL